ncbi:MAG: lipoxygenase family protein [Chloroflexota bacterium]
MSILSNIVHSRVNDFIGGIIHSKYEDLPAIPIATIGELKESLENLNKRKIQTTQPRQNLTMSYTLNGQTATGRQFLYGADTEDLEEESKNILQKALEKTDALIDMIRSVLSPDTVADKTMDDHPLMQLSIEEPQQFTMSWPVLPNIYRMGEKYLDTWVATLTDTETANQQFWPTIASYGLPFNLLILQKVITPEQQTALKLKFETAWTPEVDALATTGQLFVIDLSIFTTLKPSQVDGSIRFTPATITLLKQDPQTKDLTPIAIRVSGNQDDGVQIYTVPASMPASVPAATATTDSAWLYALQAAKTSVTVYGIWLGHVYHWHLVTAALQMTLKEQISKEHPIRHLLDPISNHLIGFDTLLLLLWGQIAPPTSISTSAQFLDISNTFAAGRLFSDDHPLNTLARHNIDKADFSHKEPWDKYPIVQGYIKIWQETAEYVTVFVEQNYTDDRAVSNDKDLQAWISAASDPNDGNIRGLSNIDSRESLTQFLTSIIYRVTIHGAARLNDSANPYLSFTPNFPPCLQNDQIPSPDSEFSTAELLKYLPKTGTIGKVLNFYMIFAFSVPYEPLIPVGGIDTNLFFGDDPSTPCNQALIKFRQAIADYIRDYGDGLPQTYQWPLNIET